MSMEFQTLFNVAIGAVGILGGWLFHILWEVSNRARDEIRRLESTLPDIYMRRDDYRDDMAEIKNMLRLIFERLDNKADK